MTTALARREVTPDIWTMVTIMATDAHKSRLFQTSSEAAARMIMLKSYELGIPLTAGFDLINVIDGKPALSPKGCLAVIHNSGFLAGMEVTPLADKDGPSGCVVKMGRKMPDGSILWHTSTFTREDARRGKLLDKANYQKHPANMYYWRAVGYAADVLFPDVTGGMGRAGEHVGETTPEGDFAPTAPVTEGSWRELAPAPAPIAAPSIASTDAQSVTAAAPENDAADLLDKLADEYGADAVFAACDGALPTTRSEVDALATKLRNG